MIALTKNSTSSDVKLYFEEILNLSRSSDEFPVNLDDVWPLVYSRKDKALQTLKNSGLFIKDADYKVFPQMVENSKGGRPTEIIMISLSCLEYLIARKKREVFEVYRQVFHKAMNPVMSESDALVDTVQHIMSLPWITGSSLILSNGSTRRNLDLCRIIEIRSFIRQP